MTKVIADMTMSLDAYIAPSPDPGTDGVVDVDELQTWVMEQDPVDAEVLEQTTADTGAVVMGRRLFDIVDAPAVWTAEMAYGAQPVDPRIAFVVVSHSEPDEVRLRDELGLNVAFVNGLAAGVQHAVAAAGNRHVVIMGGGDVVGQAIEQELVDELHLHLAPMVLGGGTTLFRPGSAATYLQRSVRPSGNAVHVIYERSRPT